MTSPLLLAIDSGSPECAVAEMRDGVLRRVGAVDIAHAIPSWLVLDEYDLAVVEIPESRGAATKPADDLIRVAVAGARLAQRCVSSLDHVRELRPSEWKGNTPKPAHHARTLWPALSAQERQVLGGAKTHAAIETACQRGAKDRWSKPGATYYRAREMPKAGGVKITHDILDAAALALYALGRIRKG